MYLLFLFICFGAFICNVECSVGDRHPHYGSCKHNCQITNCTLDGYHFKNDYIQPFHLRLLYWGCEDECKYECMWKTVTYFHNNHFGTPQFYGKWPFIRCFGIQEPASAFFSFLNLYAHWKMIIKFRNSVRPDSPLFGIGHFFFIIGVNAWLWSIIFHTRDIPVTEFMDYISAFSLILTGCYVLVMRLLMDSNKLLRLTFRVLFIIFFIHHVNYLMRKQLDYGYNMKVNIMIGTLTGLCWCVWCFYKIRTQPYVWKCATFVVLTAFVTVLEVIDIPPIFYIFDCHALWHLSTAPIICIFYSFIIDDSKFLRKQLEAGDLNDVKKII